MTDSEPAQLGVIIVTHNSEAVIGGCLASLLADQGIKVARRTIAKYREAMAIPPSNERKRLA